ncbi:hypothetical protein U1737_06840 [Sphingomonas sp. LB3N6]
MIFDIVHGRRVHDLVYIEREQYVQLSEICTSGDISQRCSYLGPASVDELTTSIVGIDFPKRGQVEEQQAHGVHALRPGGHRRATPRAENPFDENAIGIWSERNVQLGYVSAERVPLIGKETGEDEVTAVFQAMHGSGTYIRIWFGGGLPTLPDPVPDVPRREPPRMMRPAQRPVYDPTRSILTKKVPNSEPNQSSFVEKPADLVHEGKEKQRP